MQDEARTSLRLPHDIHEMLIALAKIDRRTLNAEMIYLIEQAAAARNLTRYSQSD